MSLGSSVRGAQIATSAAFAQHLDFGFGVVNEVVYCNYHWNTEFAEVLQMALKVFEADLERFDGSDRPAVAAMRDVYLRLQPGVPLFEVALTEYEHRDFSLVDVVRAGYRAFRRVVPNRS